MAAVRDQVVLVTSSYEDVQYTKEEEYRRIHRLPEKGSSEAYQTRPDVWTLTDGDPSKVQILGRPRLLTDLRRSITIKDSFKVTLPSKFRQLFSKVIVGVGSKHIYAKGDFMKEHLDTKREDLNGLPHIMTLIVTNDVSPMRVCGKRLYTDEDGHSSIFVLFTLNCPHEILPVSMERHSFAFPVYGIYKGLTQALNTRGTSVYQAALNHLEDVNPFDDNLAESQGWVDMTEIGEAISMFKQIRLANGEWLSGCERDNTLSEDDGSVSIKYTDEHGERQELTITTETSIAHATNITITPIKIQRRLFDHILALIRQEETAHTDAKDAMVDVTAPSIRPDTRIPDCPFTVTLRGHYDPDDGVEDLIQADRAVYDFLTESKRPFVFVPRATRTTEWPTYIAVKDTLVTINRDYWSDEPEVKPSVVTDAYVEHNDEGQYDPRYTALYGLFVVN